LNGDTTGSWRGGKRSKGGDGGRKRGNKRCVEREIREMRQENWGKWGRGSISRRVLGGEKKEKRRMTGADSKYQ
jgi:hypothetical protein